MDELSFIFGSTGRMESARSPQRKSIRGILQYLEDVEDSREEEVQKQRQQLIQVVQRLEKKIVGLDTRPLDLPDTNQNLIGLDVYLPGMHVGMQKRMSTRSRSPQTLPLD